MIACEITTQINKHIDCLDKDVLEYLKSENIGDTTIDKVLYVIKEYDYENDPLVMEYYDKLT